MPSWQKLMNQAEERNINTELLQQEFLAGEPLSNPIPMHPVGYVV